MRKTLTPETVCALIALGSCFSMCFGDTVVSKDNRTCNGSVVRLDADGLRIKAYFVGKTEGYVIERSKIKTIEFNQNTLNS
jgi:hypothetical protein